MPFFIFSPIVDVDTILDRYVNLMKKASTISVSIKVTNTQFPGEGSGNLTVAKPNRISFSSSWAGQHFSFFQDGRHIAEVNRTSKKYREWPPFPTLLPPPGEVSALGPYSFPKLLLLSDLRFIGDAPKKKLLASLPGSRNQTVLLNYNTMNGPAELEVTIDEIGRLVRSSSTIVVEGSRVTSKMTYSNWVVDRSYPASIFAGILEPGYSADVLPYEDIPIQSNEKFTLQGWAQNGRTGSISSVLLSKKYVLVAVRGGCEHSTRLLRFLEQNLAQIQRSGATVGVLSLDGSSPKSKFPTFVESNHRGIQNLRIAGTPTLFSVTSAGVTKQVWFPVITDQPSILLEEILASLK